MEIMLKLVKMIMMRKMVNGEVDDGSNLESEGRPTDTGLGPAWLPALKKAEDQEGSRCDRFLHHLLLANTFIEETTTCNQVCSPGVG